MALPVYSTGTVSVAAGGTIVTGVGTLWSSANVKQGDFISINNLQTVLVTEVTDATHLVIPPWTGAVQTGVAYKIFQNYVGRVVGVAAAEDVGVMLEKLHTDGLPFIVGATETVPDPSYGDDGQMAFKPTTGQWWTKTGGIWVTSAGLGPITEAPINGLTYGRNNAVWSNVFTSTVKGHTFGTNAGTAYTGAVAVADANLLLYNLGATNWAGWGIDTGGNAWLRTGISGTPAPALAARADQNVVANKFNSLLANFGGTVGPSWQPSTPLAAEVTTAGLWPVAVKGSDRGTLYLGTSAASIYSLFTQGTTGNIVGQISGTTTTTTYATTSDGRRKPVREQFSGLDIINALNPILHNWAEEPEKWSYGLIAQEAAEVLPQMIARGDDDPDKRPGDDGFINWGADYSLAVPVLIRAVQELQARIAALEAAGS